MPTINQTNTIDITPERFLNACSDNEIRELGLLLNSKRFDSSFSGNSDNSDPIPEIPALNSGNSDNSDIQKFIDKLGKAGHYGDSVDSRAREIYQCIKGTCFEHDPENVYKIFTDIYRQFPIIHMGDIIAMLPYFNKLETVRLSILVKSPQIKNQE